MSKQIIVNTDTGEVTYLDIPDMEIPLDEVKQAKITELNDACNQSILGKFTSTINGMSYYFSYDTEAQSNITKVGRAFDKGLVTTVKWTAYDSDGNTVRIDLDANSFDAMFTNSLIHLNTNISKLRDDLEPKVEEATEVEQVLKITWNS